MVPVGGGRISTRGCLQDGCEVLNLHITVLSGTDSPFRSQCAAVAGAVGCERPIASPSANVHECEGQVAVLINYVRQMVELITSLDVVCAPPAALEERHVLVELIVLTGIDLCETLIEGGSGRTRRQRQTCWQRTARVIKCGRTCRGQAGGLETQVHSRSRPAKVVIVLEEVAEASGGDDLRG